MKRKVSLFGVYVLVTDAPFFIIEGYMAQLDQKHL